jgi:hypothetical protein
MQSLLLTVCLAASLLLLTAIAKAHIKNEASQFPDIEYSDARFDIVMLVGAGVIPETPVFEPDKPLSRRELAAWVALARGLKPGGETPDTDELAQAANDAGLVDSLEGDATFGELNDAFFGGNADAADAETTPTKAEAAGFIAAYLDTEVGLALLERRNLSHGETGIVGLVETQEGHHGSVYLMTVGGMTQPMDEHGRVANGPTDLLQWEGRTVRRSFVRKSGDSAVWVYLEAEPPVAAAETAADGAAATPSAVASTDAGETSTDAAEPVDRSLLFALVAIVVALGFILFFRRRRTH